MLTFFDNLFYFFDLCWLMLLVKHFQLFFHFLVSTSQRMAIKKSRRHRKLKVAYSVLVSIGAAFSSTFFEAYVDHWKSRVAGVNVISKAFKTDHRFEQSEPTCCLFCCIYTKLQRGTFILRGSSDDRLPAYWFFLLRAWLYWFYHPKSRKICHANQSGLTSLTWWHPAVENVRIRVLRMRVLFYSLPTWKHFK